MDDSRGNNDMMYDTSTDVGGQVGHRHNHPNDTSMESNVSNFMDESEDVPANSNERSNMMNNTNTSGISASVAGNGGYIANKNYNMNQSNVLVDDSMQIANMKEHAVAIEPHPTTNNTQVLRDTTSESLNVTNQSANSRVDDYMKHSSNPATIRHNDIENGPSYEQQQNYIHNNNNVIASYGVGGGNINNPYLMNLNVNTDPNNGGGNMNTSINNGDRDTTPRKVDSHDDTVDLSPTKSEANEAKEASLSAREVARRKKRQKTLRCYIITAVVVLLLAIGLPLGAVVMLSKGDNNGEHSAATGEHNEQLHSGQPQGQEPPAASVNTTVFVDTPLASDVISDNEVGGPSTTVFPPEDIFDVEQIEQTDLPTEIEQDVTVAETLDPVDVDVQTAEPTEEEIPVPDNDFIYPTLLTLSQQVLLDDSTTPQGRAYNWMIQFDRMVPQNLNLVVQRYSIIALDFALNNDNFAAFANPDVHECEFMGITCNSNNEITEINWAGTGLNGRLIPEIQHLNPSLTVLDLADNDIRGTLDDLWFNTNLQKIYLQNNKLSGQVNPRIGTFMDLESLYLTHNQFTGTIPYSLASTSGQPKPTRWLSLAYNNFSGPIPPNFRMRSLYFLDLGHNSLSGPLPLDWDTNMVQLRHLWLDNNKLSGTIPDYWPSLGRDRLRQMYMNDNQFTGTVPVGWSSGGFLTNLNLENNQFSRRVDSSMCSLSVFEEGELVEFRTDCDICSCKSLCDKC